MSLVDRCYSAEEGQIIADFLKPRLKNGERVTLSFEGVSDIPSTFANTAFAALLDVVLFEQIKDNLIIVDANRQIADMVRRSIASRLRQMGQRDEDDKTSK